MQRQLRAVVAHLEAERDHLHAVAARTPEERWSTRAHAGRWSVAECVAHLNLTSQAFLPLLRAALAQAPATGNAAYTLRRDLAGYLLGYAVGPMPRALRARMRFRTSAGFVPTGNAPRAKTVAEFDNLQTQLIAFARESDGRAIDRVRISSPFDARAKYNVYSALVLLPRHQERHLIQAEDVWGTP
jgi:hypothetical protein